MSPKTLCIIDKLLFICYVFVILYCLNPIMLGLCALLVLGAVLSALSSQILTAVVVVLIALAYHFLIWIPFRRIFMRYECMYFNIFAPHLPDRRINNVPVKNDKRKPIK